MIASGRLERYKAHPRKDGFTNYNVCSSSNSWTRQLSPMLLGPFPVSEPLTVFVGNQQGTIPGWQVVNGQRQMMVTNLENFWQCGKVYDIDCTQIGVGRYSVNNAFLERRTKGYLDPKPHRRVFPKAKGYRTMFGFYDGECYGYLEARCKVYCRYYAALTVNLPSYQELLRRHKSGENILVLGYDGRDVQTDYQSMVNEILNPALPFGHELVLCCMLQGFPIWEEQRIINEARRRDGGGWDVSFG